MHVRQHTMWVHLWQVCNFYNLGEFANIGSTAWNFIDWYIKLYLFIYNENCTKVHNESVKANKHVSMTELLSKVKNEPTAGHSILTDDCSWSLLATRPRNKFCRLIRYSLEYIAQSSHARKHAITFCCFKNEHHRHTKICKYFTTMSTTTSCFLNINFLSTYLFISRTQFSLSKFFCTIVGYKISSIACASLTKY